MTASRADTAASSCETVQSLCAHKHAPNVSCVSLLTLLGCKTREHQLHQKRRSNRLSSGTRTWCAHHFAPTWRICCCCRCPHTLILIRDLPQDYTLRGGRKKKLLMVQRGICHVFFIQSFWCSPGIFELFTAHQNPHTPVPAVLQNLLSEILRFQLLSL